MDDSFDLNTVTGEARLLFDHAAAQAYFGASVFWLRRLSAFPTEQEAVAGWQITREGTRRGIVELISEAP
jgi:GH25 family lysozyme M1 (1,4-beta-N-acetylmuramidase)